MTTAAAFIYFQIFEQRTTVVTGDGRHGSAANSKQPLRGSGFICFLRAIRHVLRVVFSRAEEGQFSVPRVPFRTD